MTTLDLIQAKLSDLDEPTLQQIYALIEQLSSNSSPGFLRQSEQSAFDAAGDIVGCVEGPSDLSTNKAHMAGFGQS
jgi:hypothetical protein